VGLGNDIARDDGVGLAVARRLAGALAGRPGVEAIELPWAGLSLLDVLFGRRRAAIVDCLTTGAHPPGTIVRLDERHLGGSARLNSVHDLDLSTALALGRRLGWPMPSEVAIWGVEGGVVDELGEGLSPAVAAAVDRVAAQVLDFLDRGGTVAVNAQQGAPA
jgi:hydrogenase maturation protease